MSETLLFTPPAIIQPADAVEAQLAALDSKVDGVEHDGLRFRWEFGKTLAAWVASLPYGTRTEYVNGFAERLGKSSRELRYRMQFWEACPTDGEFCNVLQKFGSWHDIVNDALPRDMGGLKSSTSVEWYTPAEYIEAAREVMGGIDLDPATSEMANEIVKAPEIFTKDDDGLEHNWHGRVWLNPPYGAGSGLFTTKLVEEYDAGRVTDAVLLLNAYGFDSGWFQPLWRFPICFTDHRIEFYSPARKSGGPANANIFVYLGDRPERFAGVFSAYGTVVRSWP